MSGRRSKRKGSSFERKVAKQLSLWWSGGKRDDLFWRTAGSGAFATNRTKQGKETAGNHFGDIASTDSSSALFSRLVTVEIKCGYSWSLDELIFWKQTGLSEFLHQVFMDSKKSCTPFWMLVAKKDRKDPIVFCPKSFLQSGGVKGRRIPSVSFWYQRIPCGVLPFSFFLEDMSVEKLVQEFGE